MLKKSSPRNILSVLAIRDASLLVWAALLLLVLKPDTNIHATDGIPIWRATTAGLEDVLFVLPAFFISRRSWRFAFLSLSTILFCAGHSYQGFFAMASKAPFVLVSYFLVAEYGILTTVISHSLNDVVVVIIARALLK